jgi:beta-glucanase (GH16 family)
MFRQVVSLLNRYCAARGLASVTFLLLAAAAASFTADSSAAELPAAVPPPTGQPWVQTFSADFTLPTASLEGWTIEHGTGSQYGLTGWGNNEAETYTDDPANLNISGGALNLVAVVKNGGKDVTSARIHSQKLFSQAYGLFQFTAKLPAGKALWPGLWLMPVKNAYGGWPTSGEIDVMESGGANSPANKQVQGTYHSGRIYSADVFQTGFYNATNDPNFDTTNFNTYDLLWLPGPDAKTPGMLKWYVNGHLYETRTGGWFKPSGAENATAPFDQPFYIIMNLAIGGPHTPYTGGQLAEDGTYTMQVSHVQVFAVPSAEKQQSKKD